MKLLEIARNLILTYIALVRTQTESFRCCHAIKLEQNGAIKFEQTRERLLSVLFANHGSLFLKRIVKAKKDVLCV